VFLKHEIKHKTSREGGNGTLFAVFRKITVSVVFMFTNVLTFSEENHNFTEKDTNVNCTAIFL
jgi:hypothetical protein